MHNIDIPQWVIDRVIPSDDEEEDWSAFYRLVTPKLGASRRESLTRGSEGHQIWKELDVLAGDPIIEKTKFSVLVQGSRSSDLDAFLRERGIDTIVIT